MLECSQVEQVYFNTNYTEKSTVLVVELVITKLIGGDKIVVSGGYAVCTIFEFAKGL